MFGQIFIILPKTGHGAEFHRAIALGGGIETEDGGRRHYSLLMDCVSRPTIFGFRQLHIPAQAVATQQFLTEDHVKCLLRRAYNIKED